MAPHDDNNAAAAFLAIAGIAFAGAAMKDHHHHGFYGYDYGPSFLFGGPRLYDFGRISTHAYWPNAQVLSPGLDTSLTSDVLSNVIANDLAIDPSGRLASVYTRNYGEMTFTGPMGDVSLDHMAYAAPSFYTTFNLGGHRWIL